MLLNLLAMNTSPKFAHADIVKVIATGETGTVKTVHESGHGHVYTLQLTGDATTDLDAPEDEIELVRRANEDETGFAIRYIS
jgi:hypothetical protein